jgi:hypothetical protein
MSQWKDNRNKIKHIKIIHYCCCCYKRIETYWDEQGLLKGKWKSFEMIPSEILNCYVADPKLILCNQCYGTGEWKKKGIKLK